jgi:hypothetical protein
VRARVERFLRVAPIATLALLAAGLTLAAAAIVADLLRTPLGFSSFPAWIILAVNGGIALGGSLLLILSAKATP